MLSPGAGAHMLACPLHMQVPSTTHSDTAKYWNMGSGGSANWNMLMSLTLRFVICL